MHCYQELHPGLLSSTASDCSSRRQSSAVDQHQQPASSTTGDSSAAAQQAFKRHRSKSLDSRAAALAGREVQQNGFGSHEDLLKR